MLRVAIASAGDLLRDSIESCLKDSTSFKSVRGVQELLQAVETKQVDALILDDQFDNTTWLGNLVVALRKLNPQLIIVVIGTWADGMLIYELFDAGISGYLFRGDELRSLIDSSLQAACAGKPYLSPTASIEYTIATHSGLTQLDSISRRILRLMGRGVKVKEIAIALDMNERKVRYQLEKLFSRFGVTSKEDLLTQVGLMGYLREDKEYLA